MVVSAGIEPATQAFSGLSQTPKVFYYNSFGRSNV